MQEYVGYLVHRIESLVNEIFSENKGFYEKKLNLLSCKWAKGYGSTESHRSAEITHWVKSAVRSFLQIPG
jgi:hypothetical protein